MMSKGPISYLSRFSPFASFVVVTVLCWLVSMRVPLSRAGLALADDASTSSKLAATVAAMTSLNARDTPSILHTCVQSANTVERLDLDGRY